MPTNRKPVVQETTSCVLHILLTVAGSRRFQIALAVDKRFVVPTRLKELSHLLL